MGPQGRGDELLVFGRRRPVLLLVHGEHAAGDRESAEDVDAGQHHAKQPSHFDEALPAAAPAISAPTMMTLEMALVTAISGVCSAGVTDQTT